MVYYLLAAIGGIVVSELNPTEHLTPFYCQIGATGGAILVAISATATIFIGMNGLVKLQTMKSPVNDENSEVRNQTNVQVTVVPTYIYLQLTVDGQLLKKLAPTTLRGFGICSGNTVLIFLGVSSAVAGVVISTCTIMCMNQVLVISLSQGCCWIIGHQ